MTTAELYRDKAAGYYSAVGHHILGVLPGDARHVLELGCGTGATGAAAKAGRPDLIWTGLEMDPASAAQARTVLDEVIEGNAEEMSLDRLGAPFDAIVASEVLEHLVDPWKMVAHLAQFLKPGGVFIASSPNVATRQIVGELLAGRFDYEDQGPMDRTHLRWFTPASYAAIFRGAGLEIVSVGPSTPLRAKARLIDRVTGGRFRHLFFTQILVVARRPAAG